MKGAGKGGAGGETGEECIGFLLQVFRCGDGLPRPLRRPRNDVFGSNDVFGDAQGGQIASSPAAAAPSARSFGSPAQ